MLLITRREGESIIINGNIEVKVIETRGGRVKLGVAYPQGDTVYRKELFLKIQEENESSMNTNANPMSFDQLISKMENKDE